MSTGAWQPLGVQAGQVPRPSGSPNSQRASHLCQRVTQLHALIVTAPQGFYEDRGKPRIKRRQSQAEWRGSRPKSLAGCLLVDPNLAALPSQILPHRIRTLLQAAAHGHSLAAVISGKVRPSSSKGPLGLPQQTDKLASSGTFQTAHEPHAGFSRGV